MDPFRSLQALSLAVLALMFAPAVLPPLRPHGVRLRMVALLLYLLGGLAILLRWLAMPG